MFSCIQNKNSKTNYVQSSLVFIPTLLSCSFPSLKYNQIGVFPPRLLFENIRKYIHIFLTQKVEYYILNTICIPYTYILMTLCILLFSPFNKPAYHSISASGDCIYSFFNHTELHLVNVPYFN